MGFLKLVGMFLGINVMVLTAIIFFGAEHMGSATEMLRDYAILFSIFVLGYGLYRVSGGTAVFLKTYTKGLEDIKTALR